MKKKVYYLIALESTYLIYYYLLSLFNSYL